jgi:hypothetical protein
MSYHSYSHAEQTPHGQIWDLHFLAALRCVHVARLLLCHSLDSTARTSVVGNKGSCHVPTPAALHCCLRRVAHQLYGIPSPAKTTCLVTCCLAGFIDRERTGSTHVLFFACACAALLVFHSWPRPSCLPAQLPTLTHLLISCHIPSSSTIEQTLRLPSHDHCVDCPRPAMPQLPPSTRPEHQTPKPCVRKQNT